MLAEEKKEGREKGSKKNYEYFLFPFLHNLASIQKVQEVGDDVL